MITFAIFFGYMLSKIDLKGEKSILLIMMDQLNTLLTDMVGTIIEAAPYGVFFLVTGAIAGSDDLISLLQNVGVLVIAVILGLLFHVLVSLSGIYFALTGMNPYAWIARMTDAYFFAFSCASSAATLPVTLKTIESTGEVPESTRRFVCSLGATINMDGSGIYFPCAIIFLAYVSGHGDEVNAGTMATLAVVSTLGAVGASPIPNSGMVMLITIWQAVFPQIDVPPEIAYCQAVDWLLDRCVTAVNVCGDTLVCRIISHMMNDKKIALSQEEFRASVTLGEGFQQRVSGLQMPKN